MDSGVSTIEFLSVGDLVGQAVRVYRRYVLMILQVLLVPAIGCILAKFCMYLPFTLFKTRSTGLDISAVLANLSSLLIASICALIGLIILLYSLWVIMLRLFALIKLFVGRGYLEEGSSFDNAYKKAYQEVKAMQGAILGVFTISTVVIFVAIFVWMLIIIITGVMEGLHLMPAWCLAALMLFEFVAMLVSVVFISIVYWLALNEMVLAGKPIQAAVAQANSLAWPNFWRVILFIFLIMLVTGLLTWSLALPLSILSIAEMFFQEKPEMGGPDFLSHLQAAMISYSYNIPFYRIVLAQAWGTIINMITWPIMYFAWALFYQDLKKRALAPDLLAKLDHSG